MGRTCKTGVGLFLQGALMLGLILHSTVGMAAEVGGAELGVRAPGERVSLKPRMERDSKRGSTGKKMFVTTGTGVSMLMGKYSPWITWGQAFRMEVGRSDTSKGSGAFVFLHSSLNNGLDYEGQSAGGCFETDSCIQGDTRFHKLGGGSRIWLLDAATIDVYGRALAGVGFSPLLMNEAAYEVEVVGEAWQGQRATVHDEIHPFAGVGVYMDFGNFGSGVAPYLAVDSVYSLGLGLSTEVLGGFSYQFGQRAVSKAPKVPKSRKPKVPRKAKKAPPVEVPEEEESDEEDAGDWRDW